jgi:DNA-binding LacI/PurR family transcriptional regulator
VRPKQKRIATQRDVAKLAGVSQATASFVLNGNASTLRIADETRERVETAARELGYHPNAVARGLLRGRMNTIGIVMAGADLDMDSPAGSYCGAVITGALEVAMHRGQFVFLFPGGLWSDVRKSLPALCDGRSDGLLLVAPPEGSDIVARLNETHVPFVLVGDQSDDPRVTSVDIDSLAASRSVMAHLLDLGHRRVAAVYWTGFPHSVMLRLDGYHAELDARRVPEDERTTVVVDWAADWYDAFRQPIVDLMSQPAAGRPTALFCLNDVIAVTVLRIVREMGLDVPNDVSITGFDGTGDVSSQDPPIATVRQSPRRVGIRAAELLLDLIGESAPPGKKEFVATELFLGGSTAPPAGM